MTTTFGWDTSHYDWSRGSMDVASAVRDGISFFTAKATEGTTYRDTYFGQSMTRARSAGLDVLGAYHVVRTENIKAQVAALISWCDIQFRAWRDLPYWFWQADVELWPYDRVSAQTGINFCHELHNQTGRWTVLYGSNGQYGSAFNNCGFALWNANYGSNPIQHYREAYPGDSSARWSRGAADTFLQYGSRTTMGRQGTCDANAFRGSLDQLKAMIRPDVHPDPAPTETETTMFLGTPDNPIVQNKSPLYLCDGLTSRPISWPDADTVVYCSGSGYGPTFDLKKGDPAQNPNKNGQREWGDLGSHRAVVRMGWGPGWGGPVGTPVTMTDADAARIADKVVEGIPPVTFPKYTPEV